MKVTIWRGAEKQPTDKSRETDRQTGGRTNGGIEKILWCRAVGRVEVEGREERGREIWEELTSNLCRASENPVIVCSSSELTITHTFHSFSHYIFRMRRFAYCKVVLATSLVWVMLDMFILLYFSECNKCDDKKERGLPGRDGECVLPHIDMLRQRHTLTSPLASWVFSMCAHLPQIPWPGRGTVPVREGSLWWSLRRTRRRWRRCLKSTSSTSWPLRWLLSIGHCLTSAWKGEQPPCS